MILDGPLNENGMQWPVISLIFFGILSFGNMYIRWSAEDDKKKAAAKKSRKKVAKKKNLMPGPLSLYAQIGCTVWMLSSAIIFSVVPCETMSGFMWKWVSKRLPEIGGRALASSNKRPTQYSSLLTAVLADSHCFLPCFLPGNVRLPPE